MTDDLIMLISLLKKSRVPYNITKENNYIYMKDFPEVHFTVEVSNSECIADICLDCHSEWVFSKENELLGVAHWE
jgi:hypothetical protein